MAGLDPAIHPPAAPQRATAPSLTPMDLLALLLTQSLNALSQAALLFFLGVGLTLIFGIMRIVNFAHGSFYMLGAFVGYSAAAATGSFWAGLVIAPLIAGAIGSAFELGLLRRLYKRDASAFLMVTFGLTLVLEEIIRLLWGVNALQLQMPDSLSGVVFLLDEPFPVYRLFLAAAGMIVAIAIWQFLERTRLGLLIRATSQNAEMVHALGVDVKRVRSGIFGIGCGLAALGGVLAAPLLTASLGMAANAVIDAFVIVIIGGMGSFLGSLIAAVLVAFVEVFGGYFFPDFALAAMYMLMLLVLVIRPGGLLGKEA
jgi:branched-chain amino acid transport system permease protein